MRIAVSSGHGLIVRGASKLIDEVDEARRVVNRLGEIMPAASVFHDDTSRTQAENMDTLVRWHNSRSRDLDVQIHFNSIKGIREEGIGVETLYREGNVGMRALAGRISRGISEASGLVLRRNDGTWARRDLGFLNGSDIDRAALIEVCFVNSRTDVRLYKENFEAICCSIAGSLTGHGVTATMPVSAPPPAVGTPSGNRNFRVLVGAFETREEALAVRDEIRKIPGREKAWLVQEDGMWQVQAAIGPNLDGAERIAADLRAAGIKNVMVI